MSYKYIENLTLADIAFEAEGKDLAETFINAALATLNVMVEEVTSIQPKIRREIHVENENLEMLLLNFLQELIYYKDSEQLLLRPSEVSIFKKDNLYLLKAVVFGEKIDPLRHPLRVDVKAVTLHHLQVKETDTGWKATVILDI